MSEHDQHHQQKKEEHEHERKEKKHELRERQQHPDRVRPVVNSVWLTIGGVLIIAVVMLWILL